MGQTNTFLVVGMALAIILSALVLSACSGSSNPSPSPSPTAIPSPGGGGAVVRSDSIISGEIRAIRQQTAGYPWEVGVLVKSSESVDSLPNPTGDKVGQLITARVKYIGDVPRPGISLYIYNIKGA